MAAILNCLLPENRCYKLGSSAAYQKNSCGRFRQNHSVRIPEAISTEAGLVLNSELKGTVVSGSQREPGWRLAGRTPGARGGDGEHWGMVSRDRLHDAAVTADNWSPERKKLEMNLDRKRQCDYPINCLRSEFGTLVVLKILRHYQFRK